MKKILIAGLLLGGLTTVRAAEKPNVILVMTDDQGWGDVGYNGHKTLLTPHLDRMAKEGIRFDRFYSGAPVCSPTRGSCLTGRHPYRYGIAFANVGRMKKEEITLAEVLKTEGYATGHFGKWHLGTLTNAIKDGRRGGRQKQAYSPPWENGFDECFSTEQAIPTYNPMQNQPNLTRYWTGPDEFATENLEGDDSRVIMDRAIPFIRKAAAAQTPFLAVIWFHTPHAPVVAGPEHRAMYPNEDDNHQHYYGCITAMDQQVGRLREALHESGIEENTMLWFCSDNGPAGRGGGCNQQPGDRQQGSAGPFRSRKGSLYEGGVRVPGLLVWPAMIRNNRVVSMPCSTSDYFPTVLDALGYSLPEARTRPYDGVSLMPLIRNAMEDRPRPIGFESQRQVSLSDNRYKIYSGNGGESFELYDLVADPGESNDISADHPELLGRMKQTLEAWRRSCAQSNRGEDYGGDRR